MQNLVRDHVVKYSQFQQIFRSLESYKIATTVTYISGCQCFVIVKTSVNNPLATAGLGMWKLIRKK